MWVILQEFTPFFLLKKAYLSKDLPKNWGLFRSFMLISLGKYCLINPFICSTSPFCHEQYGSQKCVEILYVSLISVCRTFSDPLSNVIVFTEAYPSSIALTSTYFVSRAVLSSSFVIAHFWLALSTCTETIGFCCEKIIVGPKAAILQQEIDHLNGILISDY